MSKIDNFITETIRDCDLYLQQEKRDEWDVIARDPAEWGDRTRAEYNALLDEEHEGYYGTHCVVHGIELRDGRCRECDVEWMEERIADL